MKRFTLVLLTTLLIVALSATANAATYYLTAAGAGAAQTPANWNQNPAGGGTAASNFTTNGDIFNIPSGISGIFGANATFGQLSGSNGSGVSLIVVGTMTINNGYTVTVQSKKALYVSSVNINGTIIFKGASAVQLSLVSGGTTPPTFTLASGATLKTVNTTGVNGTGCSIYASATAGTVPTPVFNAGANYEFNGSTTQGTTGLAATVNNLTVNNSAGVTLSAATTVNGLLTFTAGNLTLGVNTLTLGVAVSGASSSQYIVTNNSGVVSSSIAASGSFSFPIGNSTYNPATLTLGASDPIETFSVKVNDALTLAPPNAETTVKDREWVVTEGTPGGNNITYAFNYNGGTVGGSCTPAGIWFNSGSSYTEVSHGTVASTLITADNTTDAVGTFIVGNDGALPVEMTSFTAEAQKISAQLKWSTATEVNNYGFEIERRAIASSAWAKVGFVSGAGTSNSKHNYAYADNNLSAGTYAYRLKQIDNDGAYKYSASTEVTIVGVPKELKLYGNYPNPFNPSTKVQFTVPENGNVRLRVYNVIGQEVATLFEGAAEAGNLYTVNFDGSRMSSGLYFSVLEFGNQRITHKMMMTK